MLKVPLWWLWILGACVIVATFSLRHFNEREEQAHGRYGAGTCLRHEEVKVIYRVQGHEANTYSLRILVSEMFPLEEAYRVGSDQNMPIPMVDASSGIRPVPCPDTIPL